MTQEPKLGRICRAVPQFISDNDGSWFGTSAYIERMTAISSIDSAVFANNSLTSIPLWPYFWNLNGDGNAAPVGRSVFKVSPGRFLPAYWASSGLGSNVSTCDGPPFMNKWITCLALAAKCGGRAASGLTPSEPA